MQCVEHLNKPLASHGCSKPARRAYSAGWSTRAPKHTTLRKQRADNLLPGQDQTGQVLLRRAIRCQLSNSMRLAALLAMTVALWSSRAVSLPAPADASRRLPVTIADALSWLEDAELNADQQQVLRNLTKLHVRRDEARHTERGTERWLHPRGSNARFQVVIIGAGISGLATALALTDSGMEPSEVLILERSDRVGGRTLDIPIPGYPGRTVEAGGTWLSPTQTTALGLAERFGLVTFNSYYNYPGCCDPNMTEPSVYPEPMDEVIAVQSELARMSEQVPLSEPWEGPAEWDSMSICDYYATIPGLSPEALEQLASTAFAYASSDTCGPSLLYHLFYLRSAGGWRQLVGNRGGAQDLRLVRGSQALSMSIAGLLEDRGVQFGFNHSVSMVDLVSNPDAVIITYSAMGAPATVEADHVVIAMSTMDAGRLMYNGIPQERLQLMQDLPHSVATKAFVLFNGPDAEWQQTGDQTIPALFGLVFDYSPDDGSPGVLMTFVDDAEDAAGRLIWDGLLRLLVSTFPGVTQGVDQIFFYSWTSEHPDGGTLGPTTWMPPGLLSSVGQAWRASIGGRLHWAGSDTSDIWSGYIEGGIRAGQRAASECGVSGGDAESK